MNQGKLKPSNVKSTQNEANMEPFTTICHIVEGPCPKLEFTLEKSSKLKFVTNPRNFPSHFYIIVKLILIIKSDLIEDETSPLRKWLESHDLTIEESWTLC